MAATFRDLADQQHGKSKATRTTGLKRFTIEGGDSTSGPIGFALSLDARSKTHALKLAKTILPDCVRERTSNNGMLRIYFTPLALDLTDIIDDEDEA